jgi:hypothetical protein
MVVTYFFYSKYISADSLNGGYPAVFWVKKQMVTTVHTDIYIEQIILLLQTRSSIFALIF